MKMSNTLAKNVISQSIEILNQIERDQHLNKNELMKFAFDVVFGDPRITVISYDHMISQIVKHSIFLSTIARNFECIFIKCIENLLITSDILMMRIPIIFEKLYDCDILDQEHFLVWYYSDTDDQGIDLRLKCNIFIAWLKEDEEEFD